VAGELLAGEGEGVLVGGPGVAGVVRRDREGELPKRVAATAAPPIAPSRKNSRRGTLDL